MSDYSELKMLADAAILGGLEEGDNFRRKCRPSVIRGLVDDVARLGSRLCMCLDCGGQGEVYSGHSTHQGYNQPPEPDMDVCGTCGGDGVLGPVEDFEAIASERDQLKVDIEALKQNRFSLDNFDFDAEMTALRKDAGRYRWLNSEGARDSGMIPEFDGEKWSVIYLDNGAGGFGGGVCTAVFGSANEAVDFAMSKGAKP